MKGLYARQSLNKKDSLSIEGQIEQCKIKLLPGEKFKTYTDKGFSGKNTERPSLSELLKDIENGEIDGVIVYRLDRFSRNITDFYNMYEVMKKHNCTFVSVSESFDTSSPMGRAMMGILVTFAQMERESIQERVKDNYYYRVTQDGRWAGGTAPYGFVNGRTTDGKPTLIVDEEKIEAVKLIYKMFDEDINVSLGKVAKVLREKGFICSKSGKTTWDSSTVSKILQNTVYVKADEVLYKYLEIRQIKFLNDKSAWDGEHSCHIIGKKVGNGNIRKYTDFKEQSVYITNFEGIIESRIYVRVMERLAKNEQISNLTRNGVLEELGGKLKCSCGYAIKSYSKSTTGRPYLDCYANRSLHICKHKYNKFNFYEIQKEVGKEIQKKIGEIDNILKSKQEARNKKMEEIQRYEKQLENLVRMASLSDVMEQATFRQIEEVQKKINELQLDYKMNADIADDIQIPSFEYAQGDLDYENLTTDAKKYIVNLFIERIVLHEETEMLEIIWKI